MHVDDGFAPLLAPEISLPQFFCTLNHVQMPIFVLIYTTYSFTLHSITYNRKPCQNSRQCTLSFYRWSTALNYSLSQTFIPSERPEVAFLATGPVCVFGQAFS